MRSMRGRGLFSRLLAVVAAHDLTPDRLRPRFLRHQDVWVAETAIVFSGSRFVGQAPVHIGPRSFLNHDCFIESGASITVGADVLLGSCVRLITSSHRHADPRRRGGPREFGAIDIRDGAWVGTGATILPGVTVGEGAVIAAGAVVRTDCERHTLYAGVPARAVKQLPQ
jgi:maltose O-acetyltransferase